MTGLPGDWFLQRTTTYEYALNGTLTTQWTSAPSADPLYTQVIITDSTISYFSGLSDTGFGPSQPGKWVARSYVLRGDTIRYANYGQSPVIKELSAHALTLHYSDKPFVTPGVSTAYSESDEFYTR